MFENRLKPLDASFLEFESDDNKMCVAGLDVFAGPAPSYDDLTSEMERRLEGLPHFRRHRVNVPLGLGRPRWADDERFRLSYHLRHVALPEPGSAEQLQNLFGLVMGQPIDHERPPWEMWLVEGLEGGRFALLHKMHHALVDGIASVKVLELLLDSSPDVPDPVKPVDSEPKPTPSAAQLLSGAMLERAYVPEVMGAVAGAVTSPRRTASGAVRTAAGLAGLARAAVSQAPHTPYNASVGPHRSFSWQRESLDDVKAIKNALGGSVNDVVLATVAGALRTDMQRLGTDTEGLELFAFVPVSVRQEDGGDGVQGNEVSGLKVPLPVGEPDALERFNSVHEDMQGLKESPQVFGASAVMDSSGLLPAGLLERLTPLGDSQRYVNLVITNVPGPKEKLYLLGRELEDVFPFVPLGVNFGLGVAVVSYDDTLGFGFSADPDVVEDPQELPRALHAALADLGAHAGVELSAPAPDDA